MKKLAKFITVVLCLSLMTSVAFSLTACEDDEKLGDFYYHINDDNTVSVYVDEYNMEELVIPDQIAGLKVTGIKSPKNKQKLNQTLTSIVFPETLRNIEKNAFKGCVGLENVKLPSNLLTIEESAFANCSSLVEIRIPKGVTTIESYVFEGCTFLERAYVPNTVKSMGYGVFGEGNGLIIYLEYETVPRWTQGWPSGWQSGATVECGYTGYGF